jgi:hypothetical protein
VLAIVAYEQPVSRADINQVRGTDSGGGIDTCAAAASPAQHVSGLPVACARLWSPAEQAVSTRSARAVERNTGRSFRQQRQDVTRRNRRFRRIAIGMGGKLGVQSITNIISWFPC